MFDVLTTGAVVEELQRAILDGRIQRLGMVDALTIGAEVYAQGKRWHLIASANAENPRIHLVSSMPSTDPNLITPFSQQIRKYVRGGFITDISQPPLERVITLRIAKRMGPAVEESDETEDDDDIWSGDNVSRLDLVIEIMGRHSNLILVDEEGLVRESAKRVTSSMSRVRPILPKREYELPPPPDKPDPRQATAASMEQVIAAAKPGTTLTNLLVRGFRSVSPQIGREVAFRVTGSAESKVDDLASNAGAEISRLLRGLYQPMLTSAWQPHAYEVDDLPIGYGALPMMHLAADAEEIPADSISRAIELSQAASGVETPKDHAQRRAQLVQSIDRALQSVRTRLHSLQQQHDRSKDVDRLRRWGDTIYGYLWQIQPGDTELIAETEIGAERIPLDPGVDPKEVAAGYFEDYRKSQKAGELLPERIEAANTEIAWLEQMKWLAGEAEGFAAIEAIRQEFDEHTGGRHSGKQNKGHHASKKQSSRKIAPLTDVHGNLFYIGKSSRENEYVTFEIARANDWWLHARGVPGSHVILRTNIPTDDPDEAVIQCAASLAAWYSQSRDAGSVEVDVTQRRHVRKIRGAGPGMVTFRNEHTVLVPAADEKKLGLE